MIGTVRASDLAPLDYRYALDAAASLLSGEGPAFVLCPVAELRDEVRQRVPRWAAKPDAAAALWVEPLLGTWRTDAEMLRNVLPNGALLAVVLSRPLARLIPDRRAWAPEAVGLQIRGAGRIRSTLGAVGFAVEASHGIHSAVAIGLNLAARQCARFGCPDLGDRLQFAARRHYRVSGPTEGLATVGLLIARKRPAPWSR